jgi:sugar phosphate isomerase/epimerase
MKIGVQLYTLRSLLENDLWGTLERLAAAGFKNVELAGTYGHEPEVWAEKLASFGLQASSAHIGLDQIEGDSAGVEKLAKTLGFSYVVVPFIGPDVYAAGWPSFGQRLNELGAKYSDADLQVGYHNHDFEMVKVTDRTGLQLIFDNSSGANVIAEIDTYWIQKGNGSPGEYITSLAGRVPLVHFKDMAAEGHFTEVGDGVMDFDDIIEACRAAGVEHAIIENDNPQIDPLESVIRSRKFLLEKGLTD